MFAEFVEMRWQAMQDHNSHHTLKVYTVCVCMCTCITDIVGTYTWLHDHILGTQLPEGDKE